MKLLLIANEVSSIDKITNYTDMWSYYLSKAFRRCNIELHYHSPSIQNDVEFTNSVLNKAESVKADHIIALGVRFFSRIKKEVGIKICSSFKGLVCQVHDGSLLDGAPADINFTVRDDDWRYEDNVNNRMTRHKLYNYHVGWAADREIFYPEQNENDTLKIFVDHSTFTDTSPDYTLNVLMSLKRLRDIISSTGLGKFKNLDLTTLTDNGIEGIDLDNIHVKPYNRTAVPLPKFSAELRKSHVFIVTHNESVGLSVLEAAHCGAFVIAPKDTINPCRLSKVKHMIFNGNIDWTNLPSQVSPDENSLFVLSQNWDNVAHNIIKGLLEMKKREWK